VRIFVEGILHLVPGWQYFIVEDTTPIADGGSHVLAHLDATHVKVKKEYYAVMASTSDSTSATRKTVSQSYLLNRVRRIVHSTVIGRFENSKGEEPQFIHRERLKFWTFLLKTLTVGPGGTNDHLYLVQDLLKGDIMGLFLILEKASGIRDYGAICVLKTQSETMFLNRGETGSKFLIRLKEMQRVLKTEGMVGILKSLSRNCDMELDTMFLCKRTQPET
jgi:hypothetical protein